MPSRNQPRILIGDDHKLVAEAIRDLLINQFQIVGIATDGRTLVELALSLRPDVILVDIEMPILNGLNAALRIRHDLPETRIIFLTMNDDPDLAAYALGMGASAFIPKTSAYSELLETICTALGSPQRSAIAETGKESDEPTFALTDRQTDVLQLLAEGLSMKEVASVLKLTTRTVAFHKYRIMQLCGLHNNADLVQLAIRKHLVFVHNPVEAHVPD